MGNFDSFADAPGAIRIEGEQITLRFDRSGPTTARVSWNIPPPAAGCTSETQAYCGMLVTIDTVPASRSTSPQDGVQYDADPTADPDLHAGDEIGTSLVIGAFYEGVEKGTGQELTTFFDVSNVKETTAYYVSGYAVDCENRYHRQGVFAYSQPYGNAGTPDRGAVHEMDMTAGDDEDGVALTDGTGLSNGSTYTFTYTYNGDEVTLTIEGSKSQTYQDLIDHINQLIEENTAQDENAPYSPVAPKTGTYYYDTDTGKLYQWDGDSNEELEVLNEPTDPTALAVGDYWYDTSTSTLNRWNGTDWDAVDDLLIYRVSQDPTDTDNLTSENFWYQPTSPSHSYSWCGNVWCERTLYDQEKDPTSGISPNCGTYWYNPDDELLRQWNDRSCVWTEAYAIYWNVDPNITGSPSIADGTYWFDEGTGSPAGDLYRWGTTVPDMWTNVGRGYQDVLLDGTTAPYSYSTVALSEGTYEDTIFVNGNSIDLKLTICNATEGTFREVFREINEQLVYEDVQQATIDFRDDPTGLGIRILGSEPDSPEIQAGGDLFSSIVDFDSIGTAVDGEEVDVGEEPESSTVLANQYWVDTENDKIFQRDAGNTEWERRCGIFFQDDPTDRSSCDLWWNSDTDILYTWDAVSDSWVEVSEFIQDTTDPAGAQSVEQGDTWYDGTTLYEWDGSAWQTTDFVTSLTDPTEPVVGTVWYDGTTWYDWDGTQWNSFDPVESDENPSQSTISTGTYWYDTQNEDLFVWNGTNWIMLMYTTEDPTPDVGDLWYDTQSEDLKVWNGTEWILASDTQDPGVIPVQFILKVDGNLALQSTDTGSTEHVEIHNSGEDSSLLGALDNFARLFDPVCGTDGLEGVPSYAQLDVGTDGSSDERRELSDSIRRQLGWPVIEVELDKEQMNTAINKAMEQLRQKSSAGYRRGFMKLPIRAGYQRYQLSNKGSRGNGYENPDGTYTGYDAITQVMGVYRVTSAFMTSSHGSGVFGQVVLQHLYNMGTFDLLSYHLVAQYIEQLEHLFASRIVFSWNESNRVLWIQQAFSHDEIALMDVAIERTEQDLLSDRYTGPWIEKWALTEAKMMLSQIRGKYSTLPGAGGGVSLNSADLIQQASDMQEELIAQIDDYQVNNPEEFGMNSELIIG